VKAREYVGPLGILAAGAIGFSLLCSVSMMAMSDLTSLDHLPITVEPLNIVDLAVSNLETAAALTKQVVTAFVPTQTLAPTDTLAPGPVPSDTATPRRFVTITPTGTRRARPTFTPTLIPTKPPTSIPPTNTSVPPPTITLTPMPTPTDIPTSTPIPTATDVPTDTPPPPPDTDTPNPPTPVDTVPPDTPLASGSLLEATGTSP
jgi:hypothetical protein